MVYGGRTFLRRILDLMNSMASAAKYRLSQSFYRDLSWWDSFLHVFNGRRPFLDNKPTVDVMTDSSSLAAGAFFRGDWIYFNFELDCPAWSSLHITHKETLAIILAAKRWAPQWANHRVLIHSDNQAAVHIINKGTTANALIMEELRDLFWLSARHNFHITALHIEGLRNTVADALSRLHEPQFLSRFYTALLDYLPQRFVNTMPLRNHMSVDSCRFVFSRCTGPPARYAAAPGSA